MLYYALHGLLFGDRREDGTLLPEGLACWQDILKAELSVHFELLLLPLMRSRFRVLCLNGCLYQLGLSRGWLQPPQVESYHGWQRQQTHSDLKPIVRHSFDWPLFIQLQVLQVKLGHEFKQHADY